LEFQLRLQEFIEFVRADNNLRAITYAKKYLAPWAATHMKELQRVIATLAFKRDTVCATYKVITGFLVCVCVCVRVRARARVFVISDTGVSLILSDLMQHCYGCIYIFIVVEWHNSLYEF
jgi:hypothetical protein